MCTKRIWFLVATMQCLAMGAFAGSYSVHYQFTTVTQWHNKFTAPYQGDNSLSRDEKDATSVTSTIFASYSPIKNLNLIVNPEISGGQGLSGAVGAAGFPNGECFRVGNPSPIVRLARYVVDYYIPLTQEKSVLSDQANQCAMTVPKSYLRLIGGKFCLADYFCKNIYSQDARSQFMNWSFMSPGAYDYAANTLGYTMGVGAQVKVGNFVNTLFWTQVPKEANGLQLDNFGKGYAIQNSLAYSFGTKGLLEMVAFYNRANMGNYNQAITGGGIPDVTLFRSYSNHKVGLVLNNYWKWNDQFGTFAKLSYNDGKNETWAFTEIDRSVNIGGEYTFPKTIPFMKTIGLGYAANGLSNQHRDYLAKGGYGFIIGDGQLKYGSEQIIELYTKFALLNENIHISPDVQYIINPAYNKDRGPVVFYGIRTHVEF